MADVKISDIGVTTTTLASGHLFETETAGGVSEQTPASVVQAFMLANLHSVNLQTGTTYTYLSGDRGKLVSHTNGSAIAGTLPQATGSFGSGWFMLVQNRGAGTLTITPTTSTIDGAATLLLTTGNGAFVISDGTNYYTARATSSGGGTPAGSTTQVQYNNAGAFGAEAGFEYDASSNTLTVANATTTGLALTAASGTGSSGFRLPHGAAPTSPTNGDMWTTSAGGLYVQINGVTVGPLAATGGGSLTNFTESVNTSAPNATVPVVQLLATNGATNVDIALAPKGTGALAAQIATSSSTGGNKRGTKAVDWQMTRSAAAQAATGTSSVVGGGENNTASSATSTVAGGLTNTASSTNSTVGGGTANTASGSNSTVAGGSTNTASGNVATVGGGISNNASGANYPTISGGATNTASGTYASIGGGGTNTASGSYSTVPGGLEATTRGLYGAYALASGGLFGTVGANQFGRYIYKVRTTDNTVTTLALDGGSPAATTVIALPNESVYAFRALASATQQSNTVGAGWTVTGTIRRDANAASTTLVGTPTVTSTGADAGASSWTIAAVANTTRGSLEFTVTGENSKTIRWTIVVETAETTE